MEVLVGLICLVGPVLGLQQAVSYQNFRASHGQGHPTFRADGSWSQSFGGGHRSFGGGFRGLGKEGISVIRINNPYVGSGHQNFAPLQQSYSPTPTTVGLYTDEGHSLGPTAAPSPVADFQPQQLNYSPPPQGNTLISNGPTYSDAPTPSYSPDSLSQSSPPQTFGNDRLPTYTADSVGLNYNNNELIHTSIPTTQYIGGPQLLENRAVNPEFRSEAQTPQPSYQQSTLGPIASPNPSPEARSLNFHPQDSGLFNGNYQYFERPKQQFISISHGANPGPLPTQDARKEYVGVNPTYNTNLRTPNSDFISNTRSQTSDFGPNVRGANSDFGPGGRNPVSDYGQHNQGPNADLGPNGRGPVSDYGQNNARAPNSDFGPNGRGPISEFGTNGRGPNSNFGPTGRTPNPEFDNGRRPNSDFVSNSKGPSSSFGTNGRNPNSDFKTNGKGSNSNYGRNEKGHGSDFGSEGDGQTSDFFSDSKNPSSDFIPSIRDPISNFGSNGRGQNSNFGQSGRGSGSSFGSNNKTPSSNFDSSERGPSSDFKQSGRGQSSEFGLSGKGPSSEFKTSGRGSNFDFKPNGRGSSFDFKSNGRHTNSDFNGKGGERFSDFGPNVRRPNSDFGPNRTPSYPNELNRPNFNDRRNPNASPGGVTKPFGKALQSALDNTGPQTFTDPNKPALASPPKQQGTKSFDGRKPQGSSKFGLDRGKDFGPNRDKSNFSAEEGGQSFESDFKSSELGGQSFEADIPDFPSGESYFNSQESYGSFESPGKGNFDSDEGKGSYEIGNTPSYNSREKGFSDRDTSFDSQERSQSVEAERSDNPQEPHRGPGQNYRSDGPSPGRPKIAEEKKLDLAEKKTTPEIVEKKEFDRSDESGDKSFSGPESRKDTVPTEKKSPPLANEPTPLPFSPDLAIRKPYSAKIFPEKKASFAIEKFVPFEKSYSLLPPSKRMAFAVESRIPYEVKVPFPGGLKRIYKRHPPQVGIVSLDSKTGMKETNLKNVPVLSELNKTD